MANGAGAFVLFHAGAAAETVAPEIGPPPDWVVATRWTAPETMRANASGEDFLLLDEQTDLATGENYHHHVYQLVTDAGREDAAQVYFYFDPSYQKLTLHHLKLIRAGQELDRLDPAKIQVLQQERDLDSQQYNGERSVLVILDDVRVGDIIDLAYTRHGTNPVFGGKFIDAVTLDWAVPMRDQHYRLLVPGGRKVLFKTVGSSQAQFGAGLFHNEQELTWRRSNAPVVESEQSVPSSHHVFTFLDMSEFQNWGEVVQWALPLYATDQAPHPLLDAIVSEIRAKALQPEQQAVAALAFVQQEIRYLGIEMGPGSHRPSEPEEVLRRRFGDCKDKSRLLTAILRRLHFSAAPALVHSSRRQAAHQRLATPYAFDHVIVALDLDGRRYLLDPTLSYQRGDQLRQRQVGRYGPYLRIAPETASLEDAELGPRDTSRSVINEVFNVAALEKPAEFAVTTVNEGRAAEEARAHFATHTLEQTGREYLNYYTPYYPGIKQTKPVETSDDPHANVYTVREFYRVENLFERQDDGRTLRAEFEPASIWEYARTPNLAQRQQPFAINHPVQIEEKITLNLPEEWKVTPFDESVTDEAFSLLAKAANPSPSTVSLEYAWSSRADRVEISRLPEYATNAEKARKELGYRLTWTPPAPAAKNKPVPAVAPPVALNWPMIGLATGIVISGSYVSWQLGRRKNPRPPEPPLLSSIPADGFSGQSADPEGLGGWLILVATGLFLRPIFLLKAISGAGRAYFNVSVWNALTTPGGAGYKSHYALVASAELCENFVLLVSSALLIVLFFRRSHLFPRSMQIFFCFALLVALLNLMNASLLEQELGSKEYLTVVQMLVICAVWIPYFQVSRRVRRTFVR